MGFVVEIGSPVVSPHQSWLELTHYQAGQGWMKLRINCGLEKRPERLRLKTELRY
jgi:hypothetical protein